MATITPLTEYPPLLDLGLHFMTLDELRQLCVDRFPDSTTRKAIMDGLDAVVCRLEREGIQAEIWVNGSFLTQKRDPLDSDIVLRIPIEAYENGTPEQRATLDWVRQNQKLNHHCDSYIFYVFPAGDKRSAANDYLHAYWFRQFGFSRGQEMKGIAALRLGAAS